MSSEKQKCIEAHLPQNPEKNVVKVPITSAPSIPHKITLTEQEVLQNIRIVI